MIISAMRLSLLFPIAGAVCMMAPASHASLRHEPDRFFQPGGATPEGFPADALYPKGRLFPFAIGDGKSAREYGKLGVVLLPSADQSAGDARHVQRLNAPETSDQKQSEVALSAQVRQYAADPGIAFWWLQPENLRPGNPQAMKALAAASAAVRVDDPARRPLWTIAPANAKTGLLSHLAPWVGYLGAAQPITLSAREHRALGRWQIERSVEAVQETDSEATPVAIFTLDPPPGAEAPAELAKWVRHDLYLSLLHGGRGAIFLDPAAGSPPEAVEVFQSAALQAARELLGPEKLGEALLFGENREHLEIDVVDGPDEVEVRFPASEALPSLLYPSVSFRDFVHGERRFLILINSAAERVTVMVSGMPYNVVMVHPLFTGEDAFGAMEGEFETLLQPWEVKVYRFIRQ